LDSLGVGAVEIGRKYAPDHDRRHQEAPKRVLATPAAFLLFLSKSCGVGGVEVVFVRPRWRSVAGGLQGPGWLLATRVFWHFLRI
jgi:hypothetical protein